MALLRENRKLSVDPRAAERSHLALARLIPWFRPGRRPDAAVDACFYTSKPGQNAFEIRATSTLFNLTWTLLIYGAVTHYVDIGPLLAPLMFLLASLAAVAVIVTTLPVAELVTRLVRRIGSKADGAAVQSIVHSSILLVACIEAAFDSHWVRWVGIVWISLVALEMIARMIEATLTESEDRPSES